MHAEKIHNGQFDFATILRAELKNKLGVKDAGEPVNFLMDNPSADAHNQMRLFLANFHFIIEGEECYHLVKRAENYCELEKISAKNGGDYSRRKYYCAYARN